MSNPSWYDMQHVHNQTFSCDILHAFQSKYKDWEVTSLFYSALHLINGYFDLHDIELPEDHHRQKKTVNEKLQRIYHDYTCLFDLSIRSRYIEGYKISDLEVKRAKEYYSNIVTYIKKI